MFIKNLLAVLKLGLLDPKLMLLAWSLRRNHKTYLSYPKLLSFLQCFRSLNQRSQGLLQLAEFGVGRGGSAIFLAWLVGQYGGTLTLFDVFGKIPPPTERDGGRAQERYSVIVSNESADYYGNIPDLLNLVLDELKSVCDLKLVEIVQGRYEDTLNDQGKQYHFDFIHIDCDWYDSSKKVLSFLQHNINRAAMIQVDDYAYWPGSRSAVDEADWLKSYNKKSVDDALVIDTGKPSPSRI